MRILFIAYLGLISSTTLAGYYASEPWEYLPRFQDAAVVENNLYLKTTDGKIFFYRQFNTNVLDQNFEEMPSNFSIDWNKYRDLGLTDKGQANPKCNSEEGCCPEFIQKIEINALTFRSTACASDYGESGDGLYLQHKNTKKIFKKSYEWFSLPSSRQVTGNIGRGLGVFKNSQIVFLITEEGIDFFSKDGKKIGAGYFGFEISNDGKMLYRMQKILSRPRVHFLGFKSKVGIPPEWELEFNRAIRSIPEKDSNFDIIDYLSISPKRSYVPVGANALVPMLIKAFEAGSFYAQYSLCLFDDPRAKEFLNKLSPQFKLKTRCEPPKIK